MIETLVTIEAYLVGTHYYSVVWIPLYVTEACYKYSDRGDKDMFCKF